MFESSFLLSKTSVTFLFDSYILLHTAFTQNHSFNFGHLFPIAPHQLHPCLHQKQKTLFKNFQKKERLAKLSSCPFKALKIVKRKHFLQSRSSDKTNLLSKKKILFIISTNSKSDLSNRNAMPNYLANI